MSADPTAPYEGMAKTACPAYRITTAIGVGNWLRKL